MTQQLLVGFSLVSYRFFSHASPCGLSDWQHGTLPDLSGYWFTSVTVIPLVIIHLSIPSATES
jgi:hypothetical protein